MREVVKTWKQSKSIALVIPKEMAEKLGIRVGDFVELILENGEIRMRKV